MAGAADLPIRYDDPGACQTREILDRVADKWSLSPAHGRAAHHAPACSFVGSGPRIRDLGLLRRMLARATRRKGAALPDLYSLHGVTVIAPAMPTWMVQTNS